MYAWIITKDHLEEEGSEDSSVGVIGPRDATPEQVADLQAGRGAAFRMYDGDGKLYYSGRAVWDEPTEEAHVGPLVDYGYPNAGAVRITWPGDPAATCEL